MSRVLISGATGFIGSAFTRIASDLPLEFVSMSSADGDVSEQATWDRMQDVETVLHLAGRSFVPDSWDYPQDFLETNVMGTEQALEYCRKRGARLVFISSYLYGIPETLPVQEQHAVKPNNPYALSKHLAERTCEFYSDFYNVPVTILRPFNIFGPGQRQEFLVPKIINQVAQGEAVSVYDLTPSRDYLYIDDLVEAMLKSLQPWDGLRVFNVGSGISYSVEEIIALVQQAAGTTLAVHSEKVSRENEIQDVRADISAISDALGWQPRTDFIDGIKQILDAIRE